MNTEEYKINDKIVTHEAYQHFVDSLQLTEIEDTYHCKKTVGGGINSYEAKDKNGTIYLCISGVTGEKTFRYINKRK